jgi:hypothetical protein
MLTAASALSNCNNGAHSLHGIALRTSVNFFCRFRGTR